MSNFNNLVRQKFGRLSVVDISSRKDKSGQIYWDCVCECGNKCTVRGTSLRNGHTVSCGCIKQGIDETGNQYGDLIVIDKAERTHSSIHWECLCSCGECVVVRADILRSGKITSCGCKTQEPRIYKYKDETGNKYHKLTVLGISEKKEDGIYWRCGCECGNTIDVKGYLLRSGLKTSCGCEKEPSNEIEIGKKYNKWTVKSPTQRRGNHGERYWVCTCNCGTEREVAEPNLKNGYSKSCGCERIANHETRKFRNETNKKYGMLTVASRNLEKKDGKTYWNCICVCGKTIVVRSDRLQGKSPPDSCGCMKTTSELGKTYGKLIVESFDKIKGSERFWWCRCVCGVLVSRPGSRLRTGKIQACSKYCLESDLLMERSIKQLIQITKRSAKIRELEYALPYDEHVKLINSKCFYCNAPPSNELKTSRTKKIKMKYSGIDRIDPKKGYVSGNVRPCCIDCNAAKLDKTEANFFSWLKKAYKNLAGEGIIDKFQ